jgi:hypothetical protein
MKVERHNVFETNSSSMHSLSIKGYHPRKQWPDDYFRDIKIHNNLLKVKPVVILNQETKITGFGEKVSYLIQAAMDRFMYQKEKYGDDVTDYVDEFKTTHEFHIIENSANSVLSRAGKLDRDLKSEKDWTKIFKDPSGPLYKWAHIDVASAFNRKNKKLYASVDFDIGVPFDDMTSRLSAYDLLDNPNVVISVLPQ